MHSEQRYKICICSVILGQGNLSLYEITCADNIMFPKTLESNLTYYESDNFSDSSLHHICESENFRFPFLNQK